MPVGSVFSMAMDMSVSVVAGCGGSSEGSTSAAASSDESDSVDSDESSSSLTCVQNEECSLYLTQVLSDCFIEAVAE